MTRVIIDTDPIVALLNRRDHHYAWICDVLDSLQMLMRKFANVPMSLADACLVRMTELHAESTVVTLDADFRAYHRNRRHVIPTIMPSDG